MEFSVISGGNELRRANMSNIFAITPYADMLAGQHKPEPRGGLFAKSYDKDFKRKKKRRKLAKVSRKRNRKGC